jgi:hypothetical protein
METQPPTTSRNQTKGSQTIVVAALALITCIGALLRFYQLNNGLWYDEIMTLIGSVRLSINNILTQYPSNNSHPLYSVLAHLSVSVFGEQPWSLRLPAVIFGVASIPMLYRLGTDVTSRFEALLAASILTVSYHHIWFSQNARGYTALLFWVLLTTHLLLQWQRSGSNVALVAYVLAAALGAYTHLTMAFVVFSHALVCAWIIFRKDKSSDRTRDWIPPATAFVMSGLLTCLLYAPMLLDVRDFFTNSIPRKQVATPLWALREALSGLEIGFGAIGIVILCGAVFCAGLVSYYKEDRIVPFLFLLPAPVTLVLAVAMGRPIFPRFFFFLAGFGLLILVRGGAAIGSSVAKRFVGLASGPRVGMATAGLLTLGIVLFSVWSLPYGYRHPKQDYQNAVQFIQRNRQKTDRVAVVGTTAAGPIVDFLGQPWPQINGVDELRQLSADGHNVWLVYTFPIYIQASQPELWEVIQNQCEQICRFTGTVAGGDIEICRWSPTHAETQSPQDLPN